MPVGWDTELSDDYEWVPLRLPPEVTRVNSQPRYSASMDSRVEALIRVTSGGKRKGAHSYSSDSSVSQPTGILPCRAAVNVGPPHAR